MTAVEQRYSVPAFYLPRHCERSAAIQCVPQAATPFDCYVADEESCPAYKGKITGTSATVTTSTSRVKGTPIFRKSLNR